MIPKFLTIIRYGNESFSSDGKITIAITEMKLSPNSAGDLNFSDIEDIQTEFYL